MPPTPSNRQAERNLLFAGLGLTLGILNRDKVIRAFTEWMLDKKLLLGDLLVEQKAITPEQKAVIEGAVEGQIQKEGGEEEALASLRNAKDLESDLDHLQDSDIQKSMVAVKARQSLLPALKSMAGLENLQTMDSGAAKDLDPYATSLPQPPKPEVPSNDRFQRKDFLDAGALGEVWFARDTELNRTVVVKYIKPEQATNPLNKALFYLEGEVTGYLEHPNIAPVYGLGKDHQDRNYYAMRYIQGRKLTKAIHEYHAIPAKESGNRQETLIGLLQSFQSACLAVEYAHTRGVIHCDLKPDNIMVGQFGETMVVDWGLVLVKGDLNLPSVEEGKTIGPDDQPTSTPLYRPSESASGGLHERQGGIRNYVGGTPAYMAPEQLKATLGGDVDTVTSASDVFALGAVLYEILTNRAPMLPLKDKKETRQEYYERFQKGIFPKPRSVVGGIPKPLESIVLKAMGLNPKERYSSARDLADDVKRWVSDEPVVAHKEGFSEKSLRWMRKNKTAVVVAAMVLVCGMVGGIGFGLITQGYNEQLRVSEGKIKDERDKAVESEKVALEQKRKSDFLLYSGFLTLAQSMIDSNNFLLANFYLNKCDWTLRNVEFELLRNKLYKKTYFINALEKPIHICVNNTNGIFAIRSLEKRNSFNIYSLENGSFLSSFNDISDPVDISDWVFDRRQVSSNLVVASGAYDFIYLAKDNEIYAISNLHNKERLNLKKENKKIKNLFSTQDGSKFGLFFENKKIQIFSAKNLDLIYETDIVEINPNVFEFNKEGNLFAVSGSTNNKESSKILVFNMANKKNSEQYITPEEANTLVFSADSKNLFTDGRDGEIIVIQRNKTVNMKNSDIKFNEIILAGHQSAVQNLRVTNDGNFLISCDVDGIINVWDLKENKILKTFTGHFGGVSSIQINDRGNLLLSCGDDSRVCFWVLPYGNEETTLNNIYFYPNTISKNKIIAGAEKRNERFYPVLVNLDGCIIEKKINLAFDKPTSLSLSPDSNSCLLSTTKGDLFFINLKTNEVFSEKNKTNEGYAYLEWFENSERFLSYNENDLSIWDFKSRKLLYSKKVGPVLAFAISSKNYNLATYNNGEIKIIETQGFNELCSIDCKGFFPNNLSFSDDEKYLAASGNGEIKIFRTDTMLELTTIQVEGGLYGPVFFANNDQRILLGTAIGLLVFETDSLSKITNITNQKNSGLWKGSFDNKIYMSFRNGKYNSKRLESFFLDSTTCMEPFLLNSSQNDIFISVFFSDDENHIIGVKSNFAITVWDLKTGHETTSENINIIHTSESISKDRKFKAVVINGKIYFGPIEWFENHNKKVKLILKQLQDSIPDFHQEQAADNEKSQSWFAAVFHLKKLAELNPNDPELKKRLQAAEAKLKEQNEKEEKEMKQEQERAKEQKKAG